MNCARRCCGHPMLQHVLPHPGEQTRCLHPGCGCQHYMNWEAILATVHKEVAHIETEFQSPDLQGPQRYLWVVTMSGKVWRRSMAPHADSFRVYREDMLPSKDTLLALAEKAGHRVVGKTSQGV
jgi:hypothetical protein